jgi:hypothetical protein
MHVRRGKGGAASTHPIQGDELRALRRLQQEAPWHTAGDWTVLPRPRVPRRGASRNELADIKSNNARSRLG